MAGLPRSIIKKYGVSKKAWAVFRAGKTKSRSRTTSARRSSAKVTTVARRRKSRKSFRRSARRSGGFMPNGGDTAMMLGAVGYGFLRKPVSDKVAEFVPGFAGEFTDEVSMLALSYLTYKGKLPGVNKIPYSRDIGRAGVIIESALLGQALAGKFLNGTNTVSAGAVSAQSDWE